MRVQSLGWVGPLEEGMVADFGIFTWRVPGIVEPGKLQSTGLQRVGPD